MQTQCLVFMLIQIVTHNFHRTFNALIRRRNKGWQKAGTAGFQVSRLHDF